jgi:hypothetical protein
LQIISEVLYVEVGEKVSVFNATGIVKSFLVNSPENSSSLIARLVDELGKGRYARIEYKDAFGGMVKIWTKDSHLHGSYANSNKELLVSVVNRLDQQRKLRMKS